MPIATKCPGCKALFRLADEMAGKKVRCQKCGQLFAVPKPKAAAAPKPVAPKPAAPAPAPPPIISMSLDDPLTDATVMQAPQAPEVIDATVMQAPQPAEVIDATLVQAPPPEVIDATLAEAPKPAGVVDAVLVEDEAPEAPAKRRRKPQPIGSRPRPRRAGDLPRHSTVGAGALAFLAFLLIGGVMIACFAGVGALLNMGRGKDNGRAFLPPQPGPMPIARKDEPPRPLFLPAPGEVRSEFTVPAGGEIVHTITFEKDQRYNFLVDGASSQVQIDFDGRAIINRGAGLFPVILFTFIPTQTGEHTIRISAQDGQRADYVLTVARTHNPPPTHIEPNPDPKVAYMATRKLQLMDPMPDNLPADLGPCHEYRISAEPGEQYEFRVMQPQFRPVLRFYDGERFLHHHNGPIITYAVPPGVKQLTVYVTGEQPSWLGSYNLEVRWLSARDRPGPRKVAFDPAGYHRNEKLSDLDPREGNLGRAKTYLIPMEKGLGYNIDMKSSQIDAYLSLYDPQGNLVAQDDDSGGDFNARILFDPKSTGQYRLVASDFKQGTGAFSIDIARVKLPASSAVDQALQTVKRQEAGCDIVEASLTRGLAAQFTFSWAPDGKAFFLLDREGWLRRIRYPDLVEDQRLLVAPEAAQIHLTAEGLLVSTANSRELWVLDPQNLKLKRRLPRLGTTAVLAAPTLPHVYVAAMFNKVGGGLAPGVIRHDLTKAQMAAFSFPLLPANTQFLGLTPDGRHMIGSKDNHMMRWRVDGNQLVGEEEGKRFFRGWLNQNAPLVFSADSKLVLHTINNKLVPQDESKPAPPSDFGVAAYRVNDFKEPVFTFDTGFLSSAAAVDPKSGLVCLHTKTKGFVLADAQGKIVRELAISTPGKKLNLAVTRMAFHPDDGKLLAFFGAVAAPKVLLIELPKD